MKGLYLVTDRTLCVNRPLEDVVLQAVRGGVSYVQLREKELSTRAFIEEAKRIKEQLLPYGVPLIINDRVDVALAAGAGGVHIGQDDMPYSMARALMGSGAIIGLSVETWEDVERAEEMDVSYLGISPVFATPTKTDTKGIWGLEGISKIRACSRHTLVAIGGLNAANAGKAILAGADCVAVVSAICAVPDPFGAAKELSALITNVLSNRGRR
ncbi:MAG: thiamine phosphate synthase [Deltaproteobacteria bacterium]|nr:thiamine phosphate synthase [Deltaproteobacteria bacterium]